MTPFTNKTLLHLTILLLLRHVINAVIDYIYTDRTHLKNSKLHIAFARTLLFCFIAGQCMVFAHQHYIIAASAGKTVFAIPSATQTPCEKCSLCDALHHGFFGTQADHITTFIFSGFISYKRLSFSFFNFSLVKAGSRAPPLSLIC